jgi:anti-sigma factor RsiW
MRKKDINSIAYLFREMDPSEEMEFEREIEENANLLIEVESLKKVNERLNELPEVSAPREVLETVMQVAASKQEKSSPRRFPPIYYAAAALLLAGFTAGALFLESDTQQTGAENTATVGTPILQLDTSTTGNASQPESRQRVTPWVDNNEVIRFSDRIRPVESASIDSILRDSYQRLTPVTDPQQSRYYQRNLHLTGTRQ